MTTNIQNCTSQWRHNHRRAQNNRLSVRYRWKLKNSLQKSKYRTFTNLFWFITYSVKFHLHSMPVIFINGDLKFSQVVIIPYSLEACLTTPEQGNPIFSHQNDRNWYSLHYLDRIGHLLFGFGVAWEKSLGGVYDPLGKTRGNSYLIKITSE